MLRGVFPDVRFGIETFDGRRFGKFRHFAQLIWHPRPGGTTRRREDSDDPMARLCRTLYGAEWMYAVVAAPVPSREVLRIPRQDAERHQAAAMPTICNEALVSARNKIDPLSFSRKCSKRCSNGWTPGVRSGCGETDCHAGGNDPGTAGLRPRRAPRAFLAANMSLTSS